MYVHTEIVFRRTSCWWRSFSLLYKNVPYLHEYTWSINVIKNCSLNSNIFWRNGLGLHEERKRNTYFKLMVELIYTIDKLQEDG